MKKRCGYYLVGFLVALLSLPFLVPPASAGDPPPYLLQWGTHGSGSGQFYNPNAVAVSNSGIVFVVDTNNHRVQKFDGDGNYMTQWGTQGGGNGQFDWPYGIAVDSSNNVYVADMYNCRIQKFSAGGGY